MTKQTTRCAWPAGDALMIEYHDTEWGVPVRDDDRLFEALALGGMQAGLSWRTVLHKRARYREVFDHFEIDKVARYGEKKTGALLRDPGIIRNKLKINATAHNARCAQSVRAEHGSLSDYLWSFVADRPVVNGWRTLAELPARSEASDAMSAALKKRGFKFVGTTICYAFMQSAGMVNDHTVDCFRYHALAGKRYPAR